MNNQAQDNSHYHQNAERLAVGKQFHLQILSYSERNMLGNFATKSNEDRWDLCISIDNISKTFIGDPVVS